jgi:hypothetical protein
MGINGIWLKQLEVSIKLLVELLEIIKIMEEFFLLTIDFLKNK